MRRPEPMSRQHYRPDGAHQAILDALSDNGPLSTRDLFIGLPQWTEGWIGSALSELVLQHRIYRVRKGLYAVDR